MRLHQLALVTACAATLLVSGMQARAIEPERAAMVTSTNPAPCAELKALGDSHVSPANRHTNALKGRCDAEAVRAKFAVLDRDGDGHLVPKDLPAAHMLSRLFDKADLDGDKRLSLAEVPGPSSD